MLICHEQPLIEVDQIEKVPITFIFGDLDELAKYDYSKELMYEIQSEKSVRFLKGYSHTSFDGAEPNEQLQKMVLETFAGDMTTSDPEWTRYLELRHEQERIEEEERLEKEAKRQRRIDRAHEIGDRLTFWDNFTIN